jgi:hypothetical protein
MGNWFFETAKSWEEMFASRWLWFTLAVGQGKGRQLAFKMLNR